MKTETGWKALYEFEKLQAEHEESEAMEDSEVADSLQSAIEEDQSKAYDKASLYHDLCVAIERLMLVHGVPYWELRKKIDHELMNTCERVDNGQG